jgi:hypothetical protein
VKKEVWMSKSGVGVKVGVALRGSVCVCVLRRGKKWGEQ